MQDVSQPELVRAIPSEVFRADDRQDRSRDQVPFVVQRERQHRLNVQLPDGALAFPSRSEIEFVTLAEIGNETVFLSQAEFLAAARSLVPSAALISQGGSAAVIHGDPGWLAEIHNRFDAVHADGGLDPETASNLVAETILWMAEASEKSSARRLSNGVAAAIARRARLYIEERFRDPIRMPDLCGHVGAGLRTLQRCFASHYQIGPVAYIKARRLNAARRDLTAGNPSRDSVTKIAMDNGFTHLGRFSVDYRAHFGESPSETLN